MTSLKTILWKEEWSRNQLTALDYLHCLLQMTSFYERVKESQEPLSEYRRLQSQANLDVPLLARFGEICGRDKHMACIDDDAFGV